MLIKTNPASQALKEAYAALQRGDKREARHQAQVAASLEPNNEEPWLILGAASQPRASIAYLKRALEIDPQSERARGGLEWATRRFKESSPPIVRNEEASSKVGEEQPTRGTFIQKIKASANALRKAAPALRILIPVLVLGMALLLVAAWTFRPGMESAGAPMRSDPATATGSCTYARGAGRPGNARQPIPAHGNQSSSGEPIPDRFPTCHALAHLRAVERAAGRGILYRAASGWR